MAVVYDIPSNTVTVTGGTEAAPLSFEDIYLADVAGVWGVVSKQGTSEYLISANLNFGNSSNDDWFFKDTNAVAIVTGTSQHRDGTAFGRFQLGELSAGGQPTNGCVYEVTGQASNWPATSGLALGDMYLYLSTVRVPKFWRHYGQGGNVAIVKNCVISGSTGFRIGGSASEFVGNIIEATTTFGLTTILPQPLVADNRSYNSTYGIYHAPLLSGLTTVSNLVMSDNQSAVRELNNAYFPLNLIDCSSDEWTLSWATAAELALVFRKVSYSVTVIDTDNVDIGIPVIGLFDKFLRREYKKTTEIIALSEIFDVDFGNWSTTTAEGGDALWTRNTGGTPSSGTGPESASVGTHYLFCETSGANASGKTFDLFHDTSFATSISLNYQLRYNLTWSVSVPKIEVHEWDGAAWVLLATFDTQSDATGTDWKSTGEIALSNVNRIRIRATGGVGAGNDWNGDMAVDNISVTSINTKIKDMTPIIGHYVGSNGSSISLHGAHKLRVRSYGYSPASSVKEFTEAVTEKSALRADASVTQSAAVAAAHAGIVINEALTGKNIALPIDAEFGDDANWNGSLVTQKDYSAETSSPFPSHYTYLRSEITANNNTVTDFYDIDISAESADVDTSDMSFDWQVHACCSAADATASISLSFRDAVDSEISAITTAVTPLAIMQAETETGSIPALTRVIRIAVSATSSVVGDKSLYFNMPELNLTNAQYDNFGISIDCGGNSLDDVWHYLQYGIAQFGDFQGRDGIDWHNMLVRDGDNFKTENGSYKYGIESTVSRGVSLTNYGAGTAVTFARDDGSLFIVPASYTLTLSGLIAGSEVRIYDDEDGATTTSLGTELIGTESSGTSFAYTYPAAGNSVVVQVMHDGYVENIQNIILLAVDVDLTVGQEIDTNA